VVVGIARTPGSTVLDGYDSQPPDHMAMSTSIDARTGTTSKIAPSVRLHGIPTVHTRHELIVRASTDLADSSGTRRARP
jgi:hypothetical protein